MFSADRFKALHARFLGPGGQSVSVTLKVSNGTGWDEHTGIKAHVSNYQESDLVAGGSIKVGDLKLIILADSLPADLRALEQKDRIEIGGKSYAVMHWDTHTRSIGDDLMAVEATVRGG